MVDMVNNPPHYKQGAIECIEAIRAALTPEEFRGYCKGNSIKYVWRELHKGGDESLKKAVWYMLQIGERAATIRKAVESGDIVLELGDPLACAGCANGCFRCCDHVPEPASEIDEARTDRVASSHGDGEHYALVCSACNKMTKRGVAHICQ